MSPGKRLLTWLLLTLFLGLIGWAFGMRAIIPGPSSELALMMNQGEKLALEHNLPPTDGFLVVVSAKVDVSRQDFDALVAELSSQILSTRSPVSGKALFALVQNNANTTLIDQNQFVSSDGKHQIIVAQGRSAVFESAKEYQVLPPLLAEWQKNYPAYEFHYLSNSTGESEVLALIARDLDRSLIYTIPITLLILIWGFRSILAALIPLLIAGMSLIASLGISAFISQLISGISATASQLVVLLVLAIGVDYSLFFITRVREERQRGTALGESIRISQRTTGTAILWSGLIVSISLLGLLLMNDTVLTSMAEVAIVSVLVTLASCLYALPALIALMPSAVAPGALTKTTRTASSSRIVRAIINKPLLATIVVTSFLMLLSAFTGLMHLGNTMNPSTLPQSLPGMKTYALMEKYFPHLTGGNISLVLSSDNLMALEEDGRLEAALDTFRALGLRGPIRSEISEDYLVHRYKYLIDGTGNEPEISRLVHDIEDHHLKNIFAPLGINGYISGVVPYAITESRRYLEKMPLVFGSVLLLSFIFLLLAFRSIVIPLKAIILNLLSTTASFGILVLTFQYFPESPLYFGVIESFVPPLLFTILFGLSMDYHVFMLSRISEEYRRCADTKQAVLIGIEETSQTITSAALIMISVFMVAATLELPVMKQLGIGLGAAILIDATLVRTVLLPASMILLGKYNWLLPKFLQFLPKIELPE
jgi:putative drug exporter of the RND superfamily